MIAPGSTIGIIGGGQLGRMLAIAASELGYKTLCFTPEQNSPASHAASEVILNEYSNKKALQEFAEKIDVTTFEFENIPYESLEFLESKGPVYPSAHILKICRNRTREKSFINSIEIGTAAFRKVTSLDELKKAVKEISFPCVIKTTELGYDGKGQATLRSENDLAASWDALKTKEAILEAFVDFRMEISVIVARGADGKAKTYVPVQNIHKHHILDTTIAPAPIDTILADKAEAMAIKIAESLNLRGLLAVEMFVTKDNQILVNELAPRPHNSGHWTIDACVTSQFEQAIRAVCGLPLGDTTRLCDAEMKNLIGDDAKDWEKYARDPKAKLHLYGKSEIRPGRKMGHVTILKNKSN